MPSDIETLGQILWKQLLLLLRLCANGVWVISLCQVMHTDEHEHIRYIHGS